MNPIILIPSRMASQRLPGKPLADIHGVAMIVHVSRRAREADCGRVVVAGDDPAIIQAVLDDDGEAIMTRADHASGSDRIYEALQQLDPSSHHDVILNVQGDLPTIDAHSIRAVAQLLDDKAVDISTLATQIRDDEERTNPNVVKMVGTPRAHDRMRALYFTRATAPYGEGPLYHHIGLYGFQRNALKHYVSLPPSGLERREKLEQLRALEAGMVIEVALVDTLPLGVDTPADLERARALLASSSP